ncbi:MAG: Asp-tRNA(Asn)/Glu-tRNA(Gln) amidotransferase subunit GatC [bacterium]|nr:Asp-tRNA(Asn)/Glu-tRNA(Gln) amidotransferase subunit GatC [bacterium]
MEIKDVENLAQLARLELSDGEKEKLLHDMEGILAYVKQITEVELPDEVGADSIEYTQRNIWREDEIIVGDPDFSINLIKNQFPDSKDGFVKVKKIL